MGVLGTLCFSATKKVEKKVDSHDKESGGPVLSINPVSNVSAFSAITNTQNQPVTRQNSNSPDAPVDTVQLSSAAQAHLNGGDVDHDGDSH